MPEQPDITLQPLTLDLEQAATTLQVLHQLLEQIETAYYQALQKYQQQSLPGIPERPTVQRPVAILKQPTTPPQANARRGPIRSGGVHQRT